MSRGRAQGRLLLAALLVLGASPATTGQDRPGKLPVRARQDAAPVSSPTPAAVATLARGGWRNPDLERVRDLLLEVVDLVRKVHVDGERISPERCMEEAIWALRAHVRDTHLLEGDARDRLRSALARVPEGDLDACLAVLDANLGATGDALPLAKVLVRGAISVTNDPFTMLTDPQLAERYANQMTGTRTKSYGFRAREGAGHVLVIDHVFRGTSAFERGLAPGDVILEVDGRPAFQLSLDALLRRLQGDGRLTIRIHREGFARAHDVDLESRVPREENVDADLLPGAVGYVRVNAFIDRTADDLAAAIAQLEKQGARALVLDVRDNPGGAMDAVARVAAIFLGGDKVVATIEGARGTDTVTLRTKPPAKPPTKLPLVVLVNGGSASASEMVAGALKDHGRARVVGTRTYGKGVGQTFVPLRSLLGWQLLVTTMKYRTPLGTWPQQQGIAPSVVVEPFSFSPAEQEEIFRLTAEEAFDHYLAHQAAPNAEALVALARDDEGRVDRYPGLDTWARGTGTTLRPEALRRALRVAVRSWATRAKGATFHEDLRDDAQLRRAHELLASELKPVAPPGGATPAEPPPTREPAPVVKKRFF